MAEDKEKHATKKTSRPVVVLELLVVVAVLVLVIRYLVIQFEHLDPQALHFRTGRILLSVAVAASAGLLSAWVMAGYFRALDRSPGAACALVLATVPRLARHIPGKVPAMLGLAWMAHRLRQIPTRISLSVAILMSVQNVAVGLGCSAGLVPFAALAWPWALGIMAAGAGSLIMLHPSLCLGPINWLLARLHRSVVTRKPAYRKVLALAVPAALQRLCVAWMFVLFASGLIDIPDGAGTHLALSFILGSLSGFLAFFAPAGIGVQEGVLVLLLSMVMPAGEAAVLTVAARIWQTTTLLLDAGVGAVALVVLRRKEAEDRRSQA